MRDTENRLGRIETWINTRGGLRKGMIPGWRNTGITHPAISGETEGNKYIKFGRIYGTNRRDVGLFNS